MASREKPAMRPRAGTDGGDEASPRRNRNSVSTTSPATQVHATTRTTWLTSTGT